MFIRLSFVIHTLFFKFHSDLGLVIGVTDKMN